MSFNTYNSPVRRDTINNNLGPRRYKTYLYPKLEQTTSDRYIITIRGDRLDQIAYKFYGSATYWKILAQANNLGKNSLAIPEGTRLRIPVNPEDANRLFDEYNLER